MNAPETRMSVTESSDSGHNPFSYDAGIDHQGQLSLVQSASAAVTGLLTTLMSAAIGVFCWWNGAILFLKFYSGYSPDRSLFDQVSILVMVVSGILLLGILGFSVWLGLNARSNVNRQLLKNQQMKIKREVLASQVAEMHREIKEKARPSDPNA